MRLGRTASRDRLGLMMMAGRLRSRCARAAAAVGAITRPATAAGLVVVNIIIGGRAAGVVADRLENHVEIALNTKPRTQGCDVKPMRTEVMKYRRAAIEQRLDVNQVPRPVSLAEDLLAECEATRAQLLRGPRARQVVGTGHANHLGRVDCQGRARILAV